MSRISKKEYLCEIHERYKKAGKEQKKKILDEFCNICSYHRKYALKLLNRYPFRDVNIQSKKAGPKVRYNTEGVIKFIKTLWIRSNLICSKRLKSAIPIWLPLYKKSVSALSKKDEDLLRSISPATMVDIATGWTSQRAVWGKGEHNTFKAIREVELTLPFKIKGFDSDNGKEFLNYRLLIYFKHRTEPVSYTRAMAYNKNDNSHIEQKNWTVVRQYIGYDWLDKADQLEMLNDLYRHELNYFMNYFLPSVKVISKQRHGSKIKKKYDKAKTPFQRLLESKNIDDKKKLELH